MLTNEVDVLYSLIISTAAKGCVLCCIRFILKHTIFTIKFLFLFINNLLKQIIPLIISLLKIFKLILHFKFFLGQKFTKFFMKKKKKT